MASIEMEGDHRNGLELPLILKNIIAIHPGDSLSYVVLIMKTNSFTPTHNLHESIPTKSKAWLSILLLHCFLHNKEAHMAILLGLHSIA